jgi:hypothetical protein
MGEMSAEAPVPTGEVSAPVASEGSAEGFQQTAPQPEIKTNPAWQPVLDVLPTSLHEIVAPTLKDWDRGVQERFREIHSQYEPYKAYQPIIDAGVPVENIQQALGLLQAINDDPRSVWESMGSYYEFAQAAQEAQQQGAEAGLFDESYVDPTQQKVEQLENALQQLTQMLMGERQTAAEQQQMQAMESELESMKSKYGEFDREFVLTQMAAGASTEDAVKSYVALVDNIKSQANKPAPFVVGAGTGGVAVPKNPGQMSAQERRSWVAEKLKQAKES